MVYPLYQSSRLWISSSKMERRSPHWRSSNGRKAMVQGKLHFFAIQVALLVCPYASLHDIVQHLMTLRKQKGVMISHKNVISNVMQIVAFEKPHRDFVQEPGSKYGTTEVALGLLPQSHIYSLVVICHATTYRGDQVINLPKFEIQQFLNSIQRFKINTLPLVSQSTLPPMSCLLRFPTSHCIDNLHIGEARFSLVDICILHRYRQS